ncbi:PREDICTED: cytochrome c1, heme protein, mitochondrial [Polistes canadensis]|uniref:cytochrome c1, heme protein, mitochondrial n=1 Tax=Polistes canadensis TaxID=91411 RepID=UPI000718B050|nr:PREDICTED: cytochrome c1, heme protein, mitochondrial [Polistes canadensis]
MAVTLGRIYKSGLLKPNYGTLFTQINKFSTTKEWSRSRKLLVTCLGLATGGIGTLIYALENSIKADTEVAHPAKYKWDFYGMFSSLDHASVRRGWEVYKNVCSACHSMEYLAYRHLIGVSHTEEEAKALAAEIQVKDGPDATGEYFMRPGKLSDFVPSPYPNEEAARAANNGALPPDLSQMVNARHDGENYVFSLLTGYCDPPAGIKLQEGQYFNPYFLGGAIGMGQVIYDEVLEFEDGTPATASQVAKDVTTFLMWSSNHEYDDRKRYTIKTLGIGTILLVGIIYLKRHTWTVIKNTKLLFVPKKSK